ncbi:MAG TPA: phosphate acyltransferase [Anaeromyxobacter sp.]|nr:phosphate acyltransferase [Anaeromyxobacter sp.]
MAAPVVSLEQLLSLAGSLGPLRLAVAAAESDTALRAAAGARRLGIAEPVLLGEPKELGRRLAALGEDPDAWTVLQAEDDADAARRAVALIRSGEAAILMKGRLSTGELLRAVLDRKLGLRTGRLLSDVLVADAPYAQEPRLLGVTDGGVNVAPDLLEKRAILENAAGLFRRLGVKEPKVACLCALEAVSAAMPHTREARELARLNAEGEIGGCRVAGPLALDNALSLEAARLKGIDDPVAGRADVLLAPAIEAANALGKAFVYLARRRVAHVVVGAAAPVLIPSRVDGAEDKLHSIALGVIAAARREEA